MTEETVGPVRRPLPDRRRQELFSIEFRTLSYEIGIGYYDDGTAGEIFASGPLIGSAAASDVSDACILISLLVQHGVPIDGIRHTLLQGPQWTPEGMVDRPESIIGQLVELMRANFSIQPLPMPNAVLKDLGGR